MFIYLLHYIYVIPPIVEYVVKGILAYSVAFFCGFRIINTHGETLLTLFMIRRIVRRVQLESLP